MKILALNADNGGCAQYRIKEPARVVSEQFDVEIEVRDEIFLSGEKSSSGEYFVDKINEDIDLLIAQRPLNQSMYAAIVAARRQGIAVVVELDDDFHNVHRNNIAWKDVDPEHSKWSNYNWLMKATEEADWVTVSTPALTKYAPHGRVSVLRNCVPESIFNIAPIHGANRSLGWTGTVATHPEDLEMTEGSIGRALRKSGKDFHVVGDGQGVKKALELPPSVQVYLTGWVDVSIYYQVMANHLSSGIVPLDLTPFNNAKSNLKGLEMSALGIPFVASPTDEYVRLAQQGAGIIARTPEEWYKNTYALLSNPTKRTSLGKKYQKIIREHYLYERNAQGWFNAWQSALEHRKSV